MRFWSETNFGLYIAISHKFFYSWRWLWVSTRVSFTITIIIEGFSARRIKKASICSHIARTNIYFETHSMQIQIQCNALWTKNNLRKKNCYFTLILFLTSQLSLFSLSYIQQFRFWRNVWAWRRHISILKTLAYVAFSIRHANYSRNVWHQIVMCLPTKTALFLNKEHVLLYYWTCQLLFVHLRLPDIPADNPFYCDCAWLWRLVPPSCKVWNENLSCCITRTADLLEKQLIHRLARSSP